MNIKELKSRPNIGGNKKLNHRYNQFNELISEVRKKELPQKVITAINGSIDSINALDDSEKSLPSLLKTSLGSTVSLLEKEANLVTKNHNRNTWMAIGMAAFGIPLGAAFGLSLGNMSYLAIGLPIGMGIGLAVGTGMDKKAAEEGRQLDIEIK